MFYGRFAGYSVCCAQAVLAQLESNLDFLQVGSACKATAVMCGLEDHQALTAMLCVIAVDLKHWEHVGKQFKKSRLFKKRWQYEIIS